MTVGAGLVVGIGSRGRMLLVGATLLDATRAVGATNALDLVVGGY